MTSTNTASKLLLAVAALATSAVLPAGAQSPNPRIAQEHQPKIMVPTPTPGGAAGITGCWTADRNIYGPYSLQFCVDRFGASSYTVSGNGLYCHARLSWQQNWGSYGFTMSRASCGQGTDWTADRFTCVLKTGGWGDGPMIRVPVPSQGSRLDCFYQPAAWGYPPTTFSAHRT